jgi:hypothetical protein
MYRMQLETQGHVQDPSSLHVLQATILTIYSSMVVAVHVDMHTL